MLFRVLVLVNILLTTYSLPTLKVHLVAHTHDDVGWLKTVDQYFYGANNTIQHASVQIILDSLIPALEANPERKFIYVEQAFFTRWYKRQPNDVQERVKKLVNRGQLAFVNGGWCMHDEGATHFIGMMDQTTLGHDFLKNEFDYKPTIGWQIDPFGHSKTHASLMSAITGFDALFIGRIDTQDLSDRKKRRQIEGIWETTVALPKSRSDIFWSLTGSYDGNYSPLSGFNLDSFSQDEFIVDAQGPLNNVDNRMIDFANQAFLQGSQQTGENIMITMGSDFQFENAMSNFDQYDKLIRHVNEYNRHGKLIEDPFGNYDGIELFYSTPMAYVTAKHKENITFETKRDDFYPYYECNNCMMNGYFSSRVTLKLWERKCSR